MADTPGHARMERRPLCTMAGDAHLRPGLALHIDVDTPDGGETMVLPTAGYGLDGARDEMIARLARLGDTLSVPRISLRVGDERAWDVVRTAGCFRAGYSVIGVLRLYVSGHDDWFKLSTHVSALKGAHVAVLHVRATGTAKRLPDAVVGAIARAFRGVPVGVHIEGSADAPPGTVAAVADVVSAITAASTDMGIHADCVTAARLLGADARIPALFVHAGQRRSSADSPDCVARVMQAVRSHNELRRLEIHTHEAVSATFMLGLAQMLSLGTRLRTLHIHGAAVPGVSGAWNALLQAGLDAEGLRGLTMPAVAPYMEWHPYVEPLTTLRLSDNSHIVNLVLPGFRPCPELDETRRVCRQLAPRYQRVDSAAAALVDVLLRVRGDAVKPGDVRAPPSALVTRILDLATVLPPSAPAAAAPPPSWFAARGVARGAADTFGDDGRTGPRHADLPPLVRTARAEAAPERDSLFDMDDLADAFGRAAVDERRPVRRARAPTPGPPPSRTRRGSDSD